MTDPFTILQHDFQQCQDLSCQACWEIYGLPPAGAKIGRPKAENPSEAELGLPPKAKPKDYPEKEASDE